MKGKWGKHIDVAIKSIDMFSYESSSEARKMTLREIQSSITIHHHNVVNLQAICVESHKIYLITELCQGLNLHRIIYDAKAKKDYALDNPKINKLCNDLANAVTYIHKNEILHRDIKPLNVIVEKNYNLTLVDLGLAKGDQLFKKSLKTLGKTIQKGTVDYLATEIALDDFKSLYNILTSDKTIIQMSNTIRFVLHNLIELARLGSTNGILYSNKPCAVSFIA